MPWKWTIGADRDRTTPVAVAGLQKRGKVYGDGGGMSEARESSESTFKKALRHVQVERAGHLGTKPSNDGELAAWIQT